MNNSPIHNQVGRTELARDGQQWILDYLIQETGRTYHFQGDGRGELPKSVKMHAMISKHLGKRGVDLETLADIEYAREHRVTALDLYYRASLAFGRAQHPIFALNDEKRFLYESLRRTYDRVIELAPYPIEHIDIPFSGGVASGLLHIDPALPDDAPLLFYVPGCDAVKEVYPNIHVNFAHQRGMQMFSFEGPGQAECNIRGIALTHDNHERAASAALDLLIEQHGFDSRKIALFANSFGSYWGARFAARDDRITAFAGVQASIAEKFIQTDIESPRWKQLFAFLTQATDEEKLNQTMALMTMDGYMERVSCPTLLTVGEYDPRAPLDEIYALFDQLKVPAELWVMADQHHALSIGESSGPGWSRMENGVVVDWLADRLHGIPVERPGQVLYVTKDDGPYARSVSPKRAWYEDMKK